MIKSFKLFLKEAPIPDGENISTTKKNDSGYVSEYSFTHILSQLNDKGYEKLGYGSSRTAFSCDVPLEYFNEEEHKHIIVNENNVHTVIKLARSEKGIKQNRSELDLWQIIKKSMVSDYFAPILDWSGNPAYGNDKQFKLVLGTTDIIVNNPYEKVGATWVQMPYVLPAEKYSNLFKKVFTKEFGFFTYDDNENPDQMLVNFCEVFNESITGADIELYRDLSFHKKKTMNEFQIKNLEKLYFFIRNNSDKFIINDLGGVQQWGIYKDKPVILDYGYGMEERIMYFQKHKADIQVYINTEGIPIIYYKEN